MHSVLIKMYFINYFCFIDFNFNFDLLSQESVLTINFDSFQNVQKCTASTHCYGTFVFIIVSLQKIATFECISSFIYFSSLNSTVYFFPF